MITSEIESAAVAALASLYDAAGYTVAAYDGHSVATVGSTALRIAAGYTMSDKELPCVSCVCEEGKEDFETGNMELTLTVMVAFPADSEDTADVNDKLALCATEFSRIETWLRVDDLPTLLNTHRVTAASLTVVGFSSSEVQKSFDGHTTVHQLALGLYAAGANLL